jgi:hypothetical protein
VSNREIHETETPDQFEKGVNQTEFEGSPLTEEWSVARYGNSVMVRIKAIVDGQVVTDVGDEDTYPTEDQARIEFTDVTTYLNGAQS